MKLKVGVIFSIMIGSVIIANGEQNNYIIKYENPSLKGTIPQETFDELAKMTYNIIGYIEEVNTEAIINIWPEPKVLNEILIDLNNDRYITRRNLIKDFKKKGEIYSMYFDSEKYYKSNKKAFDLMYNRKPVMDMKLCLRDILIKYKNNNIRIKNIMVIYADCIDIYLTWDDKDKSESSRISYIISFSKKNNKWVLSSFLGRMAY
jgi:hypothetical protein